MLDTQHIYECVTEADGSGLSVGDAEGVLGRLWRLSAAELGQGPVEFCCTAFRDIIFRLSFKMLTYQNQITGPNSKLAHPCQH